MNNQLSLINVGAVVVVSIDVSVTAADAVCCVVQMIARGRLGEMVAAWGLELSAEVVDLLQRLMRPDPSERISLSEALNHPWMQAR